MESGLTVVIPPYKLVIDGVEVIVLEVLSTTLVSGEKYYHVICQLKYKNMLSKRFTIDCRNETEFINKVRLEISRLKLFEAIGGIGFVREVIR